LRSMSHRTGYPRVSSLIEESVMGNIVWLGSSRASLAGRGTAHR